ncbi:autotransporter outer membrane beta-barrel domain-containing protein [Bartonella sp. CB74]|uniref:autotransporter outer membrane beta-barrel domain-containing protein n=1 Tax=Bartonella sp. CB74 TaxID=3113620 RepID=UPI002F96624D
MKKSFLLSTVSGVLCLSYSNLSYALNEATPLPLTATLVQNEEEKDSLARVSVTKPPNNIRSASGSAATGNLGEHAIEVTDSHKRSFYILVEPETSSAPEAENTSSLDTESASTNSSPILTDSSKPKPRRRPVPSDPMPEDMPEKPVNPEGADQKEDNPVEQDDQDQKNPPQAESARSAIESVNGRTVIHNNVKIYDRFFAVNAQGENSTINIIDGTVDSGFVAFSAIDGGNIDGTGVTASSQVSGLLSAEGTINLKDSTITVTGDHQARGIVLRNRFYNFKNQNAQNAEDAPPKETMTNRVGLTNTKLFVENGVGIYATLAGGEVNLKDSQIHADILLINEQSEEKPAHTLTLMADNSHLEGRARTFGDNQTIFTLTNGTKWFLMPNKNAKNDDHNLSDYEQFGADERSFSNVSRLSLQDSSVIFEKPIDGRYQTLYIGSTPQQEDEDFNTMAAYDATGHAEIYLNSQWSDYAPISEQPTDRIIIEGDASGQTIVHVNLLSQDKKSANSDPVWEEKIASTPPEALGISLIQVSGEANQDSFQLASRYMTIRGLPYKYVLMAYAPGTSHADHNLFGKHDRDFWDFRLQNDYIDYDKKVRALLPQVANYLVMPNALFSAGLADINNQTTLLDNMRTTVFESKNKEKDDKNKGIFLSPYNEKVTLFSNRSPLQYGYGADVNYTALQGGIILAALEGKDITTDFGLLGTYGKLSFTPKGMKDSERTKLDKWLITAYSGIQHRKGVYVNTLLSYGSLKGDITTALIGKAAKLDGTEILSISSTIGQKLATDVEGLIFEPEAQFVYQNLMFDTISDADGFEVDMGNPHQWLIRVGGRLTRTMTSVAEDNAVSVYGKLNIIKAFGDGKTIRIGDTFHLDSTGSSIEGGIGINAYFSQNIALHGGISYRQKLQKAGVSGANFSGGVRYRF